MAKTPQFKIVFVDRLTKAESGDPEYALEKLTEAVDELVAGREGIAERLHDAYLRMHILSERDFPAPLRAQWTAAKAEFTRKRRSTTKDAPLTIAYRSFLRSPEKAKKLARAILELRDQLEDYLEVG